MIATDYWMVFYKEKEVRFNSRKEAKEFCKKHDIPLYKISHILTSA
jgi:3,4-dihydroxy-2-butanone 4-phosphate synthase